MKQPYTIYNWEATIDQIAKANAAYELAAEYLLRDIEPDDPRIPDIEKAIVDSIGNYFNDDFTAAEIAQWAINK